MLGDHAVPGQLERHGVCSMIKVGGRLTVNLTSGQCSRQPPETVSACLQPSRASLEEVVDQSRGLMNQRPREPSQALRSSSRPEPPRASLPLQVVATPRGPSPATLCSRLVTPRFEFTRWRRGHRDGGRRRGELYEVEVTLDSGDQVDVQFDEDFQIVGSKTDGPEGDEGDID